MMLNKLAVAAIVSVLCCEQAVAAYDPFFCSPSRKEVCNFDKPCEQIDVGEFAVVIDDARNSYTRCDKPKMASCATYPMVKSGDYKKYLTFEMSGRGGFSKIGPDGDWAEAVSLAGMIIVTHGLCMRQSALKD